MSEKIGIGSIGNEELDVFHTNKPDRNETSESNDERAELLRRIELHYAKLKAIAQVFRINTEEFSDEDDQRFAEEELKKESMFVKYCEEHGYEYRKDEYPFTYFKSGDCRIGSRSFPFSYTIDRAKEIKQGGRMLGLGHDNVRSDMAVAGRLVFTNQEQEALKYFTDPQSSDISREDFKYGLEAGFVMIALKELATNDDGVRKFVDWIQAKNCKISATYELGNQLIIFGDEFGEEEASEVHKKIKDTLSNANPEELTRLEMFGTRLFTKISKVFYQRIGYLIDCAKTGDSSFIENPERVNENQREYRKAYDVDENFEFTEEDAKKATELNLPWSKMETSN